ncbi:Threonyl/alanyl tRNA synthetase [Xylaria sp. FL1777]|nr:Threonyl/alanyl tRNA synthetase [Xylaria sp. FL1777]
MSSKKAKSKPTEGNEQQQSAAQKPREQINITLPDGNVHVGTSWETTPFEIARGVSRSSAERTVVAKSAADANNRVSGFYYEMALPETRAISSTKDVESLTSLVTSIVGEKQPFQRLTVTEEQLLEMFKPNKHKKHIIGDKITDRSSTTVYRCGPLIDLCQGPHVPDTGKVEAFGILKLSASYFLGDPTNDSLQRVYGISFTDKK